MAYIRLAIGDIYSGFEWVINDNVAKNLQNIKS